MVHQGFCISELDCEHGVWKDGQLTKNEAVKDLWVNMCIVINPVASPPPMMNLDTPVSRVSDLVGEHLHRNQPSRESASDDEL